MDIIETSEGSQTGYLAVDAIEYAHCIRSILYNTVEENDTIKNAARFVHIQFDYSVSFGNKKLPIHQLFCLFFNHLEHLAIVFRKKNFKLASCVLALYFLKTEHNNQFPIN